MDDYPRAPFLTAEEAHHDLQSWMIISTRTLARVSALFGESHSAEANLYNSLADTYTQVLLDNFWDESR